ncbi:hypothetical protein Xkoz_00101 [Xenorhabdus kozodoii]|uniref:Uncharacterized protein n=1 Tax=Xenorhabdus kozodoii TaxID=351676 RepID=A0A2D0LHI5_9GAMM|nr:hypothetical protein Xkoz_00101 [Xenorhabdus kozodoii]
MLLCIPCYTSICCKQLLLIMYFIRRSLEISIFFSDVIKDITLSFSGAWVYAMGAWRFINQFLFDKPF